MPRRRISGAEVTQEMRRLYVDCKYSLSKVGKELRIHPQIVKNRLEEIGVTIRKKPESMVLFHRNKRENKEIFLD